MATVAELTDRINKLEAEIKKLKGAKKQKSALTKISKAAKATTKAVQYSTNAITRPLNLLVSFGSETRGYLSKIGKLQEEALTRGLNFYDVFERSQGSIEGLTGAMYSSQVQWNHLLFGLAGNTKQQAINAKMQVGIGTAQEAVMAAFGAGLDTNSLATSRLLAANTISEKTQKQLAKMIRANTVGLGISQEGLDRLAITALGLRNQFKLTTVELQEAIGALGERLKEFGALGIAEPMQEFAMLLGSELGKGAHKMGSEMLAAATDGGKIGTVYALQAGKNLGAALDGSTRGIAAFLYDIAKNSQETVDKFESRGAMRMVILQQINAAYGGFLVKGSMLWKEIIKKFGDVSRAGFIDQLEAAKRMAEVKQDIKTTWENIKGKIMDPLHRILLQFSEKLLKFAEGEMFQGILDKLQQIAVWMGAWETVVKPVLVSVGLAIGGVIKAAMAVVGAVFTKLGIILAGLTTAVMLIPNLGTTLKGALATLLHETIGRVVPSLGKELGKWRKGLFQDLQTGGMSAEVDMVKGALANLEQVWDKAGVDLLKTEAQLNIDKLKDEKAKAGRSARTNELLAKIDANLNTETIRREYALSIDERVARAAENTAQHTKNFIGPPTGIK